MTTTEDEMPHRWFGLETVALVVLGVALVWILLLAAAAGEARRCARLEPGTPAHETYCSETR